MSRESLPAAAFADSCRGLVYGSRFFFDLYLFVFLLVFDRRINCRSIGRCDVVSNLGNSVYAHIELLFRTG